MPSHTQPYIARAHCRCIRLAPHQSLAAAGKRPHRTRCVEAKNKAGLRPCLCGSARRRVSDGRRRPAKRRRSATKKTTETRRRAQRRGPHLAAARAERQPPPTEPTDERTPHSDGERSTTARAEAPTTAMTSAPRTKRSSRKPWATATARKKPTLSQGSASCRRMHPTPTREDRKGCSAAWSAIWPSARKTFERDETKLRKREEKSSELKIKREETLKRGVAAAALHRMCEAKYKDQARRDEILTDMRRTEASLLHAS